MLLHRLALARFAQTAGEAFSGQGGILGNGRWHTRGQRVVYTAETISLAMAEALVHLQRSENVAPFCRWSIDVPEAAIDTAHPLPANWARDQRLTRALGDSWLASKRSAALRVPSALVPEESNVLLNPAHPGFSFQWIRSGPMEFRFDSRLTAP